MIPWPSLRLSSIFLRQLYVSKFLISEQCNIEQLTINFHSKHFKTIIYKYRYVNYEGELVFFQIINILVI